MSKVLTDNRYYQEIAQAIRDKAGIKDTMKPSEMAEKITEIETGVGETSPYEKTLSIVAAGAKTTGIDGRYAIPSGTTKIQSSFFDGYTITNDLVIPRGVTSLGNYAFRGACKDGTRTLYYPSTITSASGASLPAFTDCIFKNIEFGNGIRTIGSSTFSGASLKGDLELPNTLTAVNAKAFYGCLKDFLFDLYIPKSVSKISFGSNVFSSCEIKKIIIEDGTVNLPASVFVNMSALEDLEIPEGVTAIGKTCFANAELKGQVIIPSTIETTGAFSYSPFKGATINGVKFNEGLEVIPSYIFEGAIIPAGVNIEFPKSLKEIKISSFKDCSEMDCDIVLPEGLTALGSYCFYGTAIKRVFLPSTVESIFTASPSFTKCDSLTDIYCAFSKGAVAGAPWGATNATIHYDWDGVIPDAE